MNIYANDKFYKSFNNLKDLRSKKKLQEFLELVVSSENRKFLFSTKDVKLSINDVWYKRLHPPYFLLFTLEDNNMILLEVIKKKS